MNMTTDNSLVSDFRDNLIRYGGDLYPEVVEKAQGCYVWDADGNKLNAFVLG